MIDLASESSSDDESIRFLLIVAIGPEDHDAAAGIIRAVEQGMSDDPSLDDLFDIAVVTRPEFAETDSDEWIENELRQLARRAAVGPDDRLLLGIAVDTELLGNDGPRIATQPSGLPVRLLQLPHPERSSIAEATLQLCRELGAQLETESSSFVTRRLLGWWPDEEADAPTTMRAPGDRETAAPHAGGVDQPTTRGPRPLEQGGVPRTPSYSAPMETAVSVVSLGPEGATLKARLFYLAWLGEVRDWGSKLSRRKWAQAFLNALAENTSDFLVRILGCADGITGQTALGLAEDFRRSGLKRQLGAPSPRTSGSLDMVQVFRDLAALLTRDAEALEFDHVSVTDATCVVIVAEALTADYSTLEAFEAVRDVVRFIWVTPPREEDLVPVEYVGDTSIVLVEHAEIAHEVLRKLDVRRV